MSDTDNLQIWYDDGVQLANNEVLNSLYEVCERLTMLAACRGIAADLRTTILSGVITTVSSVTTVSTVTTLTNQTNIGGLAAVPMIPSQMNISAVLGNIDNTVGF
jgi:5,10-methenyltetrahydromethanopterin hydrogenase